jgi:DNA polymerase elongation subunit (family B)
MEEPDGSFLRRKGRLRGNLMDEPRLLVIDIETAPAELYGWGPLYNANFGVDQVKEHPYILCIGYKFVGEKEVYCDTNWDMSQKEMLNRTIELITEADAVISKNGIRFDIPWIRAEIARYKLQPLPQLTHIDLQKVVKNYFKFLSNKLDYIVRYLGIGKKVEHEGFPLWKKVMDGDKDARRRMVEYCKGDVIITEKAYKHLRPYIADHPILRAIGAEVCPTCHSKNTQRRGKRYTRYFEIQRHQCMNRRCRAWFSGKRKKVA